jgi:hypothetical protein
MLASNRQPAADAMIRVQSMVPSSRFHRGTLAAPLGLKVSTKLGAKGEPAAKFGSEAD